MPDVVSSEFLALDVLRIVSYLNLGFAGSLLLILVLSLVCCGFELHEDRKARRRRRASWSHVTGVGAIALACFVSPQIHAQSESDVPTVEPMFTKLFGSDTLTIDPVTRIPPKVAMSPNGKWVVFPTVTGVAASMTLWIAPLEGGEPARLLEGSYLDHQPVWFPRSDRILFRSTRPSRSDSPGAFLMTVPIDPDRGRATGPPRQVTLEKVLQWGFAVSPDGGRIAYVAGAGVDRVLKVIPANGGAARTVVDGGIISFPAWGADGEHIYYMLRRTETGPWAVMRVAAEGGTPHTSSDWPVWVFVSPDARTICREITATAGQPHVYEVATIQGRALARFHLPKTMIVAAFAPDGRSLLAIMQHTAAPLRVLSLDGGPARQLTETRAYDVPWGWTSDGSGIFFETELNGSEVFMIAPRDGGAMRQVRLPGPRYERYGPVLSGDGKHVLHAVVDESTGTPVLKIIDLSDGSEREISRTLWDRYRTFNPARAGDDFLYGERLEGRFEFRAVRPGGPSRLLRSFATDGFPPLIDVHDDRVAFTEFVGDSTSMSLFIARAGKPDAKRVLTVEGLLGTRGSNGPVWSPDGRMLALAYGAPDADDRDVMVVEISEDGELVGEPRIVDLEPGPNWWWGLTWLPDGSGFVLNGYEADQGPPGTNVWLVSLDPGTDAVALTADDPNDTWAFSLSPDGKYIAYSSDVHAGSSVWRVELGDVLNGEK
jgi:Tol biopolymer transport system component